MKMDQRPWVLRIEFLKAIEAKNEELVNSILDSGFDMDINLMFCKNAINICVSNGWYEMAQLLIHRGCSLSLKNDLGQQPLTVAVLRSDYWMVKLLLDNRADRTCLDLQGKSPLHYACELNNLRIVELLTEKATPQLINLKGNNCMTPLSYACEFGGAALIDHLLSKGADPNAIDYFNCSPLFSVVRNSQCTLEMVEALLNAGADIKHLNNSWETVLLCALRTISNRMSIPKYKSETRFQKILLLLVDRGCNVDQQNPQNETALQLAVQLNDITLVRKLLNAGCTVDLENKLELSPLFYACQSGSPSMVTLLVSAGADANRVYGAAFVTRMWYRRQHLLEESDLVLDILRESRRCKKLSDACRRTIRAALLPDIEKRALQLPLPQKLLNFILLAN